MKDIRYLGNINNDNFIASDHKEIGHMIHSLQVQAEIIRVRAMYGIHKLFELECESGIATVRFNNFALKTNTDTVLIDKGWTLTMAIGNYDHLIELLEHITNCSELYRNDGCYAPGEVFQYSDGSDIVPVMTQGTKVR